MPPHQRREQHVRRDNILLVHKPHAPPVLPAIVVLQTPHPRAVPKAHTLPLEHLRAQRALLEEIVQILHMPLLRIVRLDSTHFLGFPNASAVPLDFRVLPRQAIQLPARLAHIRLPGQLLAPIVRQVLPVPPRPTSRDMRVHQVPIRLVAPPLVPYARLAARALQPVLPQLPLVQRVRIRLVGRSRAHPALPAMHVLLRMVRTIACVYLAPFLEEALHRVHPALLVITVRIRRFLMEAQLFVRLVRFPLAVLRDAVLVVRGISALPPTHLKLHVQLERTPLPTRRPALFVQRGSIVPKLMSR